MESSFVLLQPMYSFAVHDISPDTPHTNWECPKTERDHIRVAYKNDGRGYLIRDTVVYPPAHDIVKPLVEGPENVHEWWKASSVIKGVQELQREEERTKASEQEALNCEENAMEQVKEDLTENAREESKELGISSDEEKKYK